VCLLYHGVGLFSLIFFKHNRATASKVLEKRELQVSVTILSSSKLSGMKLIRKIIDKAIFRGRSYRSNIFITQSALLLWLN